MTYLDAIADEIRLVISSERLPQGNLDGLFRLYAVLALAKGDSVQAADVHNAWTAWMQDEQPDHPSIKPFEELDPATQELDEPFARAIRLVASRLSLDSSSE